MNNYIVPKQGKVIIWCKTKSEWDDILNQSHGSSHTNKWNMFSSRDDKRKVDNLYDTLVIVNGRFDGYCDHHYFEMQKDKYLSDGHSFVELNQVKGSDIWVGLNFSIEVLETDYIEL